MLQDKNTAVAEKLIRFNQGAEERDAQRRASKQGKPYLNLVTTPIEIDALALIPKERALDLNIVAINLINKDLIIAVFDFEKEGVKEEVERLAKMGYKPDIFIVSMYGLKHAFSFYKHVTQEAGEIIGKVGIDSTKIADLKKRMKTVKDLQAEMGKLNFNSVSVTSFLEVILGGSLALGSSDIHFEPVKTAVGIRLRIDGVLQEVFGVKSGHQLTKDFYRQTVSRIKLLAGLKLNITDETQDGRFTIHLNKGDVEVRVAIAPSEWGEVIVLRLLDPKAIRVGLEELGLLKHDLEIVEANIKKPNGMILNTGPTGSGKTTTLYAFLRATSNPNNKVITVEDPIEYHLDGIEQTQVDEEADYTFASGLKSILRQDPDVLLIGEIRDNETAAIAINAALTGHLVFSTLHTNNAAGALPRLLDLGVGNNVIGSAMSLIIAQRLVRKVCTKCSKKRELTAEEKTKLSSFIEALPERVDKKNYSGLSKIYDVSKESSEGCDVCSGTGYKGRVGTFEMFVIDEKIQSIIETRASITEISKTAKENGMVTMQQDGILKVLSGVTTFDEIERVTGEIEWLR